MKTSLEYRSLLLLKNQQMYVIFFFLILIGRKDANVLGRIAKRSSLIN